jgi:RNA polymerase sigma factor (sigma-70 family)
MTARADDIIDRYLIAIGRGDQGAFIPLYKMLHGHLRQFVRRRVPKEEDAEDIVQVVLTKVFVRASEFDAKRGSAIGWMLTLASYEIKTQRRRTQRSREVADDDGSTRSWASSDHSPEDVTILLDLQRAASEVLNRMNRGDAELLRSAALDEVLSPASPLHRKRLSRARERVAREWTAQHGR